MVCRNQLMFLLRCLDFDENMIGISNHECLGSSAFSIVVRCNLFGFNLPDFLGGEVYNLRNRLEFFSVFQSQKDLDFRVIDVCRDWLSVKSCYSLDRTGHQNNQKTNNF